MFIFYPLKLRWTKYVEVTCIFQLSKINHRKNVKWRWFLAHENYIKASTSKRLQFFVHCNYIKKYVKMTWKFFDIFFSMYGRNIQTLIQCSVSIGMYTMLHKTASENLNDFNLGHFFLYSSPILFVIRSFMIEKIFNKQSLLRCWNCKENSYFLWGCANWIFDQYFIECFS